MIVQGDNESRLEYMLRVAIQFAEDNPSKLVDYDEATCDGFCLADDLRCVLEDMT